MQTAIIHVDPGYADSRYPLGRWVIDGSTTGDVSGGEVTFRAIFRGATDDPLQLAFSIDHIFGRKADTSGDAPRLLVDGFSLLGFDAAANQVIAGLEVVSAAGNTYTIGSIGETFLMGIPVRGDDAEIQLAWSVNSDGIAYEIYASGDLWLLSGFNDVGGPQARNSPVPAVIPPSQPQGSLQEVRSGKTGSVQDIVVRTNVHDGPGALAGPKGATGKPIAAVASAAMKAATTRPSEGFGEPPTKAKVAAAVRRQIAVNRPDVKRVVASLGTLTQYLDRNPERSMGNGVYVPGADGPTIRSLIPVPGVIASEWPSTYNVLRNDTRRKAELFRATQGGNNNVAFWKRQARWYDNNVRDGKRIKRAIDEDEDDDD